MSQINRRRLVAAMILLALVIPVATAAGASTIKRGASGQSYVWQTGSC